MSRAMALVSETLGFFKGNIGFSLRELFYYFAWEISAGIILIPLLFIGSVGKILYAILVVAVMGLKSAHYFTQIVRKAAGVDVSGKFTDKAILARSGKVFLIFVLLGIALALVSIVVVNIYVFFVGAGGPGVAVSNAANGGNSSSFWSDLYKASTNNLGLQFILMMVSSFGYALASSKITALSLDHAKDTEALEKDKVIDFAVAFLTFYAANTLLTFVILALGTVVGYFVLPLFIFLFVATSIIFPALHGVRYRLAQGESGGDVEMAVPFD